MQTLVDPSGAFAYKYVSQGTILPLPSQDGK